MKRLDCVRTEEDEKWQDVRDQLQADTKNNESFPLHLYAKGVSLMNERMLYFQFAHDIPITQACL